MIEVKSHSKNNSSMKSMSSHIKYDNTHKTKKFKNKI